MTPGTFLFDPKFKFNDGAIGAKIFVALNDGASGSYICVKTTSKPDRYGINHGCQINDRFLNYHLVKGSCFLSKNTWIQLDSFYEFNKSQLLQKVMSKNITRIGVLEGSDRIDLLKCAISSDDLALNNEKEIQIALKTLQNEHQ